MKCDGHTLQPGIALVGVSLFTALAFRTRRSQMISVRPA